MTKAFIVSTVLNFFQKSKQSQVSKRLASGILGFSALTLILLVVGCGSSAPPAPVAPAVTTNPTAVSVTVGGTATFNAAASGTPTPTVQWMVNTGSGFTAVAGATSTTLSFTATAAQNGNTFEAVFTNSAGSATTTAATLTVTAAPPALSIVKSHTGNFTVSTNGVFTIAVSNNTGAGATTAPITVTDTLPAGLTFVSGTGTNWTCAAVLQVVTCTNPGPIAGGAAAGSITLTTAVAANAPASVSNTATATTTGSGTASSTNPVTVVAAPSPDLSITKTTSGTFTPGSNATYQIAVSNTGTATTTGTITVIDTLNSAFTFVSGTGTNWTCAAVSQLVTCTNPGPVAGGSAAGNITLTVAVSGTASGSIDNTATVSDPGDTDVADKSSKATVNLGGTPTALCANAPTGNESMLHGQYAFRLQGWQGSGSGLPIAMAGSFNADGTGKIATQGDLDLNVGTPGPEHLLISASGVGANSTYKVGPDGTGAGFLGCVVLTTTLGNTTTDLTLTFSLNAAVAGVSSKGRIIEFDDITGSGNRAAGELRLQDTTAFSAGNTGALHSNYAFGGSGQSAAGRFAIAGAFALDPAHGTLSSVVFDSDSAGALITVVGPSGTGSVGSVSAVDGRATLSLNQSLLANTTSPASAIVYIVNANEMFLVGADPFGGHFPIYSGKVIVSAASYTTAAIAGNQMLHATGQNSCTVGSQQIPCATVTIGLLNISASSTTAGTLTGDIYTFDHVNGAASQNFSSASPGTIALTVVSGRVAITNVGNHPPVFYLATPANNTDPVTAFVVGTDGSALSGFTELGAASSITVSSMAGNYFFGNEDPGDNTVKNQMGVATFASSGVISGTAFNSGQNGLATNGTANGTLVITNVGSASNAAPGTGNFGPQTIVITNGTKLFLIDEGGGAASVVVIEHQ
jgi:uncharacterized repeat protein (TIGR01451 family)